MKAHRLGAVNYGPSPTGIVYDMERLCGCTVRKEDPGDGDGNVCGFVKG